MHKMDAAAHRWWCLLPCRTTWLDLQVSELKISKLSKVTTQACCLICFGSLKNFWSLFPITFVSVLPLEAKNWMEKQFYCEFNILHRRFWCRILFSCFCFVLFCEIGSHNYLRLGLGTCCGVQAGLELMILSIPLCLSTDRITGMYCHTLSHLNS